jgi:F0F1-type ATP synthase membrane subunit b/b'
MIDFFGRFYVILGAISVMKWPNLRNVAKSRYSDISDPELYLVNS